TAWFIVLFLAPLAVGFVVAGMHQKGIFRRIVELVGFSLINPIPTSWDFVFATKPSVWLLVTLKDGGQVGGVWGRHSFASSVASERDLYMEKVFKVSQGIWEQVPRSSGILI